MPEHKRTTTTGSKNATLKLKMFGKLWWCKQKLDSVGNEIYHAFVSDCHVSPLQIVSLCVYARGPAFLPPMKPTILESHVGRPAIVPTFPGTLWKQHPCLLHFILRNKRKSQEPHVGCTRRMNHSWGQFSVCYSYTRNSHASLPLSYQQCTSWH